VKRESRQASEGTQTGRTSWESQLAKITSVSVSGSTSTYGNGGAASPGAAGFGKLYSRSSLPVNGRGVAEK
jgi:hypothetical protein